MEDEWNPNENKWLEIKRQTHKHRCTTLKHKIFFLFHNFVAEHVSFAQFFWLIYFQTRTKLIRWIKPTTMPMWRYRQYGFWIYSIHEIFGFYVLLLINRVYNTMCRQKRFSSHFLCLCHLVTISCITPMYIYCNNNNEWKDYCVVLQMFTINRVIEWNKENNFFLYFYTLMIKRFFLIKFWQHDLMCFFSLCILFTTLRSCTRAAKSQHNRTADILKVTRCRDRSIEFLVARKCIGGVCYLFSSSCAHTYTERFQCMRVMCHPSMTSSEWVEQNEYHFE